MNTRIAITSLLISAITLAFILMYPVSSVKVPYIETGTIYCGGAATTTTLQPPTAITSNAIIGNSYTYYYSDVIIIGGETCRIKGKIAYTHLNPAREN